MSTANIIWGTQLLILGSVLFLVFMEIGRPKIEAGNIMMILWMVGILVYLSPAIGRAYEWTKTQLGWVAS